jgi:GNAT superfamily N-acetyltransferase
MEYFLYTTTRDPRAGPLLEDLSQEYETRYGEIHRQLGEQPEMQRYPPEVFTPPGGNFVLLIRNGETIGGGGFMRKDERTAELKRIWTRSDLRRQGVARRVVSELETQTVRQGYSRIYLTTGFRQPEAIALYLTHGYTPLWQGPIEPNVVRILPFQKELVPDATSAARSWVLQSRSDVAAETGLASAQSVLP